MHSRKWYRRHWPREVPTDPRFDGYDHRIAELWREGHLAGYLHMLVSQEVERVGPPFRQTLRHAGWATEVHFAWRPSAREPISDYDGDSRYIADEPGLSTLHAEVIVGLVVTWEGTEYEVRWLPPGAPSQSIIDRHFWEYDLDLSKPE